MTSFQKIIKYGAIVFAIYLCLMIMGMILFSITAIFGISVGMGIFDNNTDTAMMTKWEKEYSNIASLDIDLSVCKLMVQKGDTLKVDVSDVSEDFECKVQGKELTIKDKKLNRNWWNLTNVTPQVTIYVPENMDLEEIEIKTGVNETTIDYLKADKINLRMGVGKYKIEQLIAETVKIEAGAGEARIENSHIKDLKLQGGIGELVFKGKISKTADINCGMGKVELKLIGSPADYQVKAHTGLGSFKVNGQKVTDHQIIGNGTAIIKVEAGVGETLIDLIEEEKKF
ncbi:MAG: DUF4097 domain-containing protein [Clostridia bacterium]|nr:DUF4097 domain-containing protein [Clostridia bacterium]